MKLVTIIKRMIRYINMHNNNYKYEVQYVIYVNDPYRHGHKIFASELFNSVYTS